MKLKIQKLFMLCLFGMISIGANAEDIPNNEIRYEASEQLSNAISESSSGLHTNAFNTTITSHTFSEGNGKITFNAAVTSIGSSAFQGCSAMTSVTIPNSVTSIGEDAFYACSGLTNVTIPNSVTEIGNMAFGNCSKLASVTIPESVTSIGEMAFYYCTGLTSVTIPNSVTSIGERAFSGCDNVKELIYAEGTKTILRTYLTSITSVTIPNSVTEIGNMAFDNCSKLASVTIPNSVTEIGNMAFDNCSKLASVTIPESVTSIGERAFYYCTGLTSVAIGNSVTSIGSNAFQNCSSLTSVTIPNSVTSIGSNAFKGCTSLPVEDNLRYADTYLVGAVDKTLSTYNINEGTKWIGSSAFLGCSDLTSVTIPNSVTSIGGSAFYQCSGLTSVTIPNSVTEIGSYAFAYCSGLTSIEIPNSVTSIGEDAFWSYSGLTSVYVGWDKESDIPSVESYTFPYSRCTLYVPQGAADLYLAKEYWKTFKSIYGGLIIEDKDGNKTSVPIADSNPSFSLPDDINSINNSGIIRDVTITYTRNFEKAGVWQAWYMPFDVAFDDMKDAYDVAQIHGVLLDKDNNAVIAFLKLDQGTVKANTPYVVRPKKSGEVVIKPKTNLQIHPTSFYMMSATHKYTIGGVFEKTTTSGNWYALNLDGQFQLMGSGVYLRPFRIYMTIDPRTDNPYAQSATTTAKMDIVVLGDGEATGIESLTPALSEGKGAIYNLSGQRVNSIQKGQIYIMNGKKFIAK